jgi:hypothetical protein
MLFRETQNAVRETQNVQQIFVAPKTHKFKSTK